MVPRLVEVFDDVAWSYSDSLSAHIALRGFHRCPVPAHRGRRLNEAWSVAAWAQTAPHLMSRWIR